MNSRGRIKLVMIADDCFEDFRSIRKTLQRAIPEPAEFVHAATIDELFTSFESYQPDLLIQDINIPRSKDDNEDAEAGLTALFDVVNKFPGLPVIINSGQLQESQRSLRKLQNKIMPIVGVLDKSDYDKEEVLDVVVKATRFLLNASDWREEHAEVLRTRMQEAELKVIDSDLFQKETQDLGDRIHAEARQRGDESCPLSFLRVCQTLEKQINKVVPEILKEEPMGQKINHLKHSNLVSNVVSKDLHRSWAMRNNFIHNIDFHNTGNVDGVDKAEFVFSTLKKLPPI